MSEYGVDLRGFLPAWSWDRKPPELFQLVSRLWFLGYVVTFIHDEIIIAERTEFGFSFTLSA